MRNAARLFFALAAGLLAGCSARALEDPGEWYEARSAQPPRGSRLYVCHAFGCALTTPVTLDPADVGRIAAPLASPPKDAAAERAALSQSVQIFERIIGARLGTAADLGGFERVGGGDPTQMDCVDEATNTTSVMLLLASQGRLRHHRVLHPVARGILIDGRYPHATAVIGESRGSALWAIDSWPRKNGEPPVVQRLDLWLAARGGAA